MSDEMTKSLAFTMAEKICHHFDTCGHCMYSTYNFSMILNQAEYLYADANVMHHPVLGADIDRGIMSRRLNFLRRTIERTHKDNPVSW